MKPDLKISDTTDEGRSDKERERAAPVPIPAGSYDVSKLQKDLDQTSLAKNDDKRDEMRADIVDKRNENGFKPQTLGLNPGEKRVMVEDEDLGVVEERVVFDPDKAEEQEEAQETIAPVIDPKADGEQPSGKSKE